jgi:hypothetical protein
MAAPRVLVVSKRPSLREVLETALTFADRAVLPVDPTDALTLDDDELWAAVIDLVDDDDGELFERDALEALCSGLRSRFPSLPIFLLNLPGREIASAADALDLEADGLLPLPTAASNLLDAIAAAHGEDAPRIPRSLILGSHSQEGDPDGDEGFDDVTVPHGTRLPPLAGSLDVTVEGGAQMPDRDAEGAPSALAARVGRLRKTRGRAADVLRDVTERITADELNQALSQEAFGDAPRPAASDVATAEGAPLGDDVASALDDALAGEDDPSIGELPIVAASSGSLEASTIDRAVDSAVEDAVASMDRGYDDDAGTLDELLEDAVEEAGLGVARLALRARRRAESLAEQQPIADEADGGGAAAEVHEREESDDVEDQPVISDTPPEDDSAHPAPPDDDRAAALDGPEAAADIGGDLEAENTGAVGDDEDGHEEDDEDEGPTLDASREADFGDLSDELDLERADHHDDHDDGPVDEGVEDEEAGGEEAGGEEADDQGAEAELASFEDERTPTEGLVTAPTASAEAVDESDEGPSLEDASSSEEEPDEVSSEGEPDEVSSEEEPDEVSSEEEPDEEALLSDGSAFGADVDASLDDDDDDDDGDIPSEATTDIPVAQHRLAAATEAVRREVEDQAEARLRALLEKAAETHRREQDRLRQELETQLAEQQAARERLAQELEAERERLSDELEAERARIQAHEREQEANAQERDALSSQLEATRRAADEEREQRERELVEATARAEAAAEQARARAEQAERDAAERAERARQDAEEAERRARELEADAERRAQQAREEAEERAQRAKEEAEAAERRAKEEAERRIEESATELEARLRRDAQERIEAALAEQRAHDAQERDAAVEAARQQALETARQEAKEQLARAHEEAEAEAEARVANALAERDAAAAEERDALERRLREAHDRAAAEQVQQAAEEAEQRAKEATRAEVEAQLEIELARQAELSEQARQELADKLRAEAEADAQARVAEAKKRAKAQALSLVKETQDAAEARIARELEARDAAEAKARAAFEATIRSEESARATQVIADERKKAEAELSARAERIAEELADKRVRSEAERIQQEADARLQLELEAEREQVQTRIADLEAQLTHAAQSQLQQELARQEEEHQRLTKLLEERVRAQTEAQTRAALELHIAEIEERAREEADSRAAEQIEDLLAQREAAEARIRARLAFRAGRFGAVYDDERGAAGEVGADFWEEGAGRTQPLYRIPFSSEGAGEPVEPPEPPPLKALEPQEGSFGEGEIGALLFAAHYLEVTGRLDIAHEDGRLRTIYLELGEPVAFHSTLARDRSEESLLKAGLLTAAQHAELRAAEPMSARRLCATLVEDGVLKTHELFTAVRGVLTEQLLSVLEWDRGAYRYVEERAPAADRVRLVQRFDALLADGVRRKFEEGRLWRVLGGSTSILGPDDRAPRLPPLGPLERATAQLVDGTRSLEDITLEVMAPVDVVLRTSLLLLWCGAARMMARGLPDSAEARIAEHARNVRIDSERIADRLRIAREGDYFQFLGVERDVTGYEVERAADRLRERFDPARFADPAFADQRAAIEEIREVIEDARAVLGDTQLREAYQRNLRPTRALTSSRKAAG